MRLLISWLIGDPVLARSVHSVSVIRFSKNRFFLTYWEKNTFPFNYLLYQARLGMYCHCFRLVMKI